MEVDWTSLSKTISSDNQIARVWKPDLSQLNAMFYPQHRIQLAENMATDSHVLQYLVSLILNGIRYPGSEGLTKFYRWLARVPRRSVLSIFATFSVENVDVIRQRIRVEAVSKTDADTVIALLELEYDLRTDDSYLEADVDFMLEALGPRDTARPIVCYASKISPSQNLFLQKLLRARKAYKIYRTPDHIYSTDWLNLVQIPIEAGAVVTIQCFLLKSIDCDTLDYLLENGQKDLIQWLQVGLLAVALETTAEGYNRKPLLRWILSRLEALVSERTTRDQLSTHDAAVVRSVLSSGFRTALDHADTWDWAPETIYDTCCHLGCQMYYCETDLDLNNKVLQACHERNWTRAHDIASLHLSKSQNAPTDDHPSVSPDTEERLQAAVLEEDYDLIKVLLVRHSSSDFQAQRNHNAMLSRVLKFTINLHRDNAAAALAAHCNSFTGILLLLEHGRVCATSILVSQYSHWSNALRDMWCNESEVEVEDWLYRRTPHSNCNWFPCCINNGDICQDIALRALGYHAIHRSDFRLLDWLCDHRLTIGGAYVTYDLEFGDLYSYGPVQCQEEKFITVQDAWPPRVPLPSLLGIAIDRESMELVEYFLTRKPACRDSGALLYAAKKKAQSAFIEMLVRKEMTGIPASGTQYGCAALRVAIRDKNYDLVRMLARVTDVHALESVNTHEECLDVLDPLGESILRNNSIAVKILLENGGDPNVVVAFGGLDEHTPRTAGNSVLLRMTPLLVAVDVGSLPMIQLLVEQGANINRTTNMGLLRTPLQRAAEIGDFQIVEYLISKGAIINTLPVYGGATALQLAAMSGHVGIATLLVEHGADVNYPPARGPERTAFEAAAEWCRPDMMCLLVQYGAQLDLEVMEEVDVKVEVKIGVDSDAVEYQWHTIRKMRTQYERAIQFAEERGEHASKRIVERLYRESWFGLETQLQRVGA